MGGGKTARPLGVRISRPTDAQPETLGGEYEAVCPDISSGRCHAAAVTSARWDPSSIVERSSTPSKRRTDLTKTNLTPYMKFPGHARQAMEHYYKALGDKLELRGQA